MLVGYDRKTRHAILDEVKPHWIAALINMTTTAVSTERQAQMQNKQIGADLNKTMLGKEAAAPGGTVAASVLSAPEPTQPDYKTAIETPGQSRPLGGLPEIPQGRSYADMVNQSPGIQSPARPTSLQSPTMTAAGTPIGGGSFMTGGQTSYAGGPTPAQTPVAEKPKSNYGQQAASTGGDLLTMALGQLLKRPTPANVQIPQPGPAYSPTALTYRQMLEQSRGY